MRQTPFCTKNIRLIVKLDSLDDFIDLRLGRKTHLPHMPPPSSSSSHISENNANSTANLPNAATQSETDVNSRSARIRAFRAFQRASPKEREKMRMDMNVNANANRQNRPSWKAVHLMSAEEVRSLFGDIVGGLAFLVSGGVI